MRQIIRSDWNSDSNPSSLVCCYSCPYSNPSSHACLQSQCKCRRERFLLLIGSARLNGNSESPASGRRATIIGQQPRCRSRRKLIQYEALAPIFVAGRPPYSSHLRPALCISWRLFRPLSTSGSRKFQRIPPGVLRSLPTTSGSMPSG